MRNRCFVETFKMKLKHVSERNRDSAKHAWCGAIRIQSLSFVPIMSRYGVLVRSPESYVVIFTEIWC